MRHAEENIDWSLGMRPLESYAIAEKRIREAQMQPTLEGLR